MISEKKDRDDGSSSCSNTVFEKRVVSDGQRQLEEKIFSRYGSPKFNVLFACWSHNALSRMSASLIVPLELAYMNQLQLRGWNSAAVMTSVNSSMFAGLMSTMLKLWSWMFRFHRLIRKSSLLMNVSPSLLTEMLLMWYAWALAYVLLGTAATTVSWWVSLGSLRSAGLRKWV